MNRSLLNQRYLPLRKIAAGGMGEIYLARQTGIAGFQRQVVLKRIHRRLSDNTRAVEMFLNEARLAAALCHPNIVQIHDVGEEDGAYFIVMERVVGVSLRELAETATRKGEMIPMELALTVITHLLEGLRYAHTFRDETGRPLKIVHRDVCPTNILISYDGAVKVADFGIARAEDQVRQDDGSPPGKFAYMAPEAVVGELVDARSDLFSVGVLLYELTVGQRLFRAASFQAMQRVVNEPIPPPTFARAGYPVDLEIMVMRALERDPADRFTSAEEMLDELEQFAFDTGMRISRLRLGRYVSRIMGVAGPALLQAVATGETEGLDPAEQHEAAQEDLDFDKGLFNGGQLGGEPEEGAGARSASASEAIKEANAAIAELVEEEDDDDLGGRTLELRPAAQAQLRAETVAPEQSLDGSALIVTDDLVEEVTDIEEDDDEPEILMGPPPASKRPHEEVTRRYREDQIQPPDGESAPEAEPALEPESPDSSQELRSALADISRDLEAATAAAEDADRGREERLGQMVERQERQGPHAPADSNELLDQLLGPRRPKAARPKPPAKDEAELVKETKGEVAPKETSVLEDELESVDGTGQRQLDDLELSDHPGGRPPEEVEELLVEKKPEPEEEDSLLLEPDEEGVDPAAKPAEEQFELDIDIDIPVDDGLDDSTIELEAGSVEVVEVEHLPPEGAALEKQLAPADDGLDDATIPSMPSVLVGAPAHRTPSRIDARADEGSIPQTRRKTGSKKKPRKRKRGKKPGGRRRR